ncbi:hypothetical protein ACFLSA_06245 [Bacteroidota bacterium]
MKATSTNAFFFQNLRNFYHKLCSSRAFGISRVKLVFKPYNKTTVQARNINTSADYEKHNQRPNTHPVAEKQTLLKEKKKVKVFH